MTINWKDFDRSKRTECADCPRLKGVFVPPDIKPKSDLIVVGEAPGETESQVGLPFVGPSGKILEGLLEKAGTFRGKVSLINSCMCYLPGNPTPDVEELYACSGLVNTAIEEAGGSVPILGTGNVALRRLVGHTYKITPWRGSILRPGQEVILGTRTQLGPERFKAGKRAGQLKPKKVPALVKSAKGRVVVPTNHPAELLRSGFQAYDLVLADVKRAVRLSHGRPLVETGQEIVEDASVESLKNALGQTDKVVVDVETDRDSQKLSLVGVGFSRDKALVVRPSWEALATLARYFSSPQNTFVAHNAPFDLRVMARYGVEVAGPIWDTMAAAHFDRPDLPKKIRPKALEIVASRQPELAHYNWKAAFREGKNYDEAYYCGQDCCTEYFLHDKLRWRLDTTDRLDHFESVLMPLQRVLMRVEDEGLRVDPDALERLRERQRGVCENLEELWDKLCPGVNNKSPAQLMEEFYEREGMKVQKLAGRPTLNRDALDALALLYPDNPKLKVLRGMRHAHKMLKTYLNLDIREGRAHFEYDLNGTVTGRLSGDGQQVPRPKDTCVQGVEGCVCGELRSLYVPDSVDRWLAVSDLCLDPNTRVLTTDLRWVPLKDVSVGDSLIGFPEELGKHAKSSSYVPTQVVSKVDLEKPCYKITLEDGQTIIASDNHQWVTRKYKQKRKWVRTEHLKPGMLISKVCSPWDAKPNLSEYERGYLAAMYDGEGWITGQAGQLGFGQNEGTIVLDHVLGLMRKAGYSFRSYTYDRTSIMTYLVTSRWDSMKIIGQVRPPKMLAKSQMCWEGRRTYSAHQPAAVVKSVEFVGTRPVIALETTTKTFIAEGLLSHNSNVEARLQALLAREEWLIEAFNDPKFDEHQAIADKCSGILEREVSRQDAKRVNLALNYGMGIRKLAKTLGTTQKEAKAIVNAINTAKPKIAAYRDQVSREASKQGYVVNVFGRRAYFRPNSRGEVEATKVYAFPAQSTAAGMLARIMLSVAEAGLKIRWTVHDEVGISTSDRKDGELLRELMMQPFPELDGWACPADLGFGKTWEAAKKDAG